MERSNSDSRVMSIFTPDNILKLIKNKQRKKGAVWVWQAIFFGFSLAIINVAGHVTIIISRL